MRQSWSFVSMRKFIVSIAWFATCSSSAQVTTERRCVFLASPQNTDLTQSAGNVSGFVQHCARTDCCMGHFRLEGGKLTPVLLDVQTYREIEIAVNVQYVICNGNVFRKDMVMDHISNLTICILSITRGCSIMQVYCPNRTCHASTHQQNFIGCVCNSDFCNTNITSNWPSKRTENKQPENSSDTTDVLSAVIIIIPAGALILVISFIIALKLKIFPKCCRPKTPTNAYDILDTCYNDLSKHLEIQKQVACGHFASVYHGTFQGLSVALKVFPTIRQQEFTKEKHVYKLPLMMHSGIIRLLEDGKIRNGFVLVLELATQGPLNAFLSRTVCDWACTLKLAQTLSQGLAYLHTDLNMNGVYKPAVAHCDLSSRNVLVRANGSCALCDFGCSTVLQCQAPQGYSGIIKSTVQMGTLQYMSPEILEGCANLRSSRFLLQADVYSLGLLLWELLMRCSDLCKGSPVPEHMLPYETELGRSPTLDHMLTFVVEKKRRPIIPHVWAGFSQGSTLHELLEDCWDHDADARLSAECAANRLVSLTPDIAL